MRQSVGDYRQSKFDWGWKYRHATIQGKCSVAEVLKNAKVIVIIKKSK